MLQSLRHRISLPTRFTSLQRELLVLQRRRQSIHQESRRAAEQLPSLSVTPTQCLYSVAPTIRVEGLEPEQPVTLKAQMVEDRGKVLHANAHYVADSEGVVDVSQSSSVGGSYKGVFPSGLLSTLKLSAEHFEFGRIHKLDLQVPVKTKILLQNGHTDVHQTDPFLHSVDLFRHFMSPGVKRIPVREGRVRGILYLPSGDGPFPGVIDMFGATGVLQDTRAALNASRGIASLALAYFNYEDIPAEKIRHMDIDYLEEAANYLCSLPQVISDKCGLIGNCFGGYLGLYTVLHVSKVKAAFLINSPVNNVCPILEYKGEILDRGSDLTFDVLNRDEDGGYFPKPEANDSFENVSPSLIEGVREALKTKHIAVAIGDADTWEFKRCWTKIHENLVLPENETNFQLKIYPNAGHLISPPYTPFASTVYARMFGNPHMTEGFLMKYGGDAVATVEMKKDTWRWMLDFVHTHIRSA